MFWTVIGILILVIFIVVPGLAAAWLEIPALIDFFVNLQIPDSSPLLTILAIALAIILFISFSAGFFACPFEIRELEQKQFLESDTLKSWQHLGTCCRVAFFISLAICIYLANHTVL